jgi:hypothetical protein
MMKMMARTPGLTKEIVDAAIEGFEAQKRRIDDQISQLRRFVVKGAGVPSSSAVTARRKSGRHRISPEGRAAIAEAQRRRWAAKKAGASAEATPTNVVAKKRRLSAAGRKAISEAAKRRWAARKS